MTTLILHHFEPYWQEGLSKYNTSFEEELKKVIDFVSHTDLDRIIVTQFEEFELSIEHRPLVELCQNKGIDIQTITYPYGWRRDDDPEQFPSSEKNKTWCQGNRDYHGKDDVLIIEDWHHEIKKNKESVLLAGAFEGECLNDIEQILSVLKIPFQKIEGLCVGTYAHYEFKGLSPEALDEQIYDLIQKIENHLDDLEVDTLEELYEIEPGETVNIEKELNNILFENLELIKIYQPSSMYSENESINTIIEDIVHRECEHDEFEIRYSNDQKKALLSKLNHTSEKEPVIEQKKKQKLKI